MTKWSIEERIAHKEYQISFTKDLIHKLEGIPVIDKNTYKNTMIKLKI